MSLDPPVAGGKFPTDTKTWSRVFKATKKVERQTRGSSDQVQIDDPQVFIANETGAPLEPWQVIGLGAVVSTGGEDGFVASKTYKAWPVDVTEDQVYAIIQERIEYGAAGPAVVLGPTTARIIGSTEKRFIEVYFWGR